MAEKNNDSRQKDRTKINRRSVLQSTAIGIVGLTGVPSMGAARRVKRQGTDPLMITGDESDPITEPQLRDEKERVNHKFHSVNTSDELDGIAAHPEFDQEDRYVASYVYKIGRDGKPMSYVGYATKPSQSRNQATPESTNDGASSSDSPPAHATAEAMKQRFADSATVDDYRQGGSSQIETNGSAPSTQAISTTSAGNVDQGSNWVGKGLVTASAREPDWGKITIEGELSTYKESKEEYPDEDGNNFPKDLWAQSLVYRVSMLPCSGCWLERNIDNGEIRQNWSEGRTEVRSPGISRTAPSDTIEGRTTGYSASIGVSSDGPEGELSWQYSQPKMDLTPKTDDSGNLNDAVWEFDFNGNYPDEDLESRYGSRCWTEDIENLRNRPDFATVGNTKCKATFIEPNGINPKTQDLTATLYYSLEY